MEAFVMSNGPLAGGSPKGLRSATRLSACGIVCPAASHFLLRGQEKVTKEKAAPPHRPSGSLRCSPSRAAHQLALAGHTKRALLRTSNTVRLFPVRAALLGGTEGESTRTQVGGLSARQKIKSSVGPAHFGTTKGEKNDAEL